MGRLKLAGLALVAVCFAAMSLSASAFAVTEILPSTITKMKGSAGATKLETLGKSTVSCKTASSEGEVKPKEAKGTFKITFKECESEGFIKAKCTTSGQETGTILSSGNFTIVHDATSGGTTYAVLFEVTGDTEFSCSFVAVKVLGSVLCLILEPTSSKATHEFHCKNNGTVGDPEETKYWINGVEHTASLKTSTNGGAEESSSENGLGKFTTFAGTTETASNVEG
jgi:hypothetical protein